MSYKNDPRQITAKFDSKCADTGEIIKKGEKCLYFPLTRKVVKLNSKSAKEWFSQKQADNFGLGDAGW